MSELIPTERIEKRILLLRGHKVMLDSDLAELYEVEISNLNKAVKRNLDRFPEDFAFQLSKEEYRVLRFQIGILKSGRGRHRKYLPYAFTEQGVAMLSSVLHSKRAVMVNIFTRQERAALLFILGVGFAGAGITVFQKIIPPAYSFSADAAKISVNRAETAELVALPGIGPVLAQRIVEDRARHGPYLLAKDLRRVKGVTSKTIERIQGLIRFD